MFTFLRRKASIAMVSTLTLFAFAFNASAVVIDPDYAPIQSVTKSPTLKPSNYSGAFSYTIPFKVPQGRSGLQPALSLTYNSSDANNASIFGYGWSSSLPSITRLTKYGTDVQYTRHDFTSSLSGELKENLLTDQQHGNYGAKVDDGSFLKYTYNANETWTVVDKQGITYTFGGDVTARIQNPTNVAQVKTWFLTKTEDKNQNSIIYTYIKDQEQVYPLGINYTGHGLDRGIFDVQFTLQDKADSMRSYDAGFLVVTAKRVSQIAVKVNNNDIRRYSFTFTTGNNGLRSLLSTITETAIDEETGVSTTKPATSFTYEAGDRTLSEQANFTFPTWISTGISNNQGVEIIDVNADTYPDVVVSTPTVKTVYINNKNSTWTLNPNYVIPTDFVFADGTETGVRMFDVNGDGYIDIAQASRDRFWNIVNSAVYTNNKNNTGWTLDPTIILPAQFVTYWNVKDTGVRIFDVNSDGLPDFVKSFSETVEKPKTKK